MIYLLLFLSLLIPKDYKKLNKKNKKNKKEIIKQVVVNMEVIMDASGSMMQRVNDEHKIFTAKNLMNSFLISNSAINNVNLAFRVYGSKTGTCKDTKLIIAFNEMNTSDIMSKVSKVMPQDLAKTPLALSLKLAGEDLKGKVGKKVIFLVTDGEETCDGDPCKVAKELSKKFDITIEVIGFDVEKKTSIEEQLNCIATDGKPNMVSDSSSLSNAINKINNKYVEKNLKIISPDKDANVAVYSVKSDKNSNKKLIKKFKAGIDQTIRPTGKNEKFEVRVLFKPNFVFEPFILEEYEKKILKVTGDGYFIANSVAGALKFSVLDGNGKEIKKLVKSGQKIKLATNKYKLTYAYPPFVNQNSIDLLVIPNGLTTVFSEKVGALFIRTKNEDRVAYYILDKEGKNEMGSYITEELAVLKTGSYKINILENHFIDIEISPNEVTFLELKK